MTGQSKTKHTPWSHGNEAIGSAAHATRQWNGTVFDAEKSLLALTFARTPEDCADLARLIAAAPDLLEAVQKLRHAVCGETGFAAAVRSATGTPYPWPALDLAEEAVAAAIAKATA